MSVRQCLRLIAELAFPISLPTLSSVASPASNADQHSPTTVIFLGLDEISQSESEIELMPQLVSCANAPMYITGGRFVSILPIITSRSQSFMNQTTGDWFDHPKSPIPMPAYLPGADHVLLSQLQLGLEFLPTVRVLCRALGNHGRLLEVLHDLLQPAASSQVLRQTLLAENKNAIEVILRAVVADERGRFYFEMLQSDFKSLASPICHALLGIDLQSEDLRMKGVFIGDAITRGDWLGGRIPVMAPLQVLVWSEQALAKSENAELRALAAILIDMFSIKAPFSSMSFEQFHSGMRV